MSETTATRGTQPAAPPQRLACRLHPKLVVGRRGPVPNMAEVELENLSETPLEIVYWMTVLQYLHLQVMDATGKVVSEGHFGDRFAPTREPQVLRLEPGERFTANVHLFATIPVHPVPPGTYTIEAVYDYRELHAVSEPVKVTV